MKKIEDYLHFYIGSDVMHSDGSTSKLIGVQHPDTIIIVHNDYGVYGEGKYGSVKLLLRPLSSMTEEEANLFFDFHYVSNGVFRWRNCIDVNKAGAEFVVNYESSRRNFRNVIKFNELNASDFPYLISRGFDLFGLIDAKLALDATKIEKV